jgi:hypothetical protein
MIKRVWTEKILIMIYGYALIVLIDTSSTCMSYHEIQWCKKLNDRKTTPANASRNSMDITN